MSPEPFSARLPMNCPPLAPDCCRARQHVADSIDAPPPNTSETERTMSVNSGAQPLDDAQARPPHASIAGNKRG
jgi:hypothetical protein